MTSRSVVFASETHQETDATNGCEKLLPLLDPVILEVFPPDRPIWPQLDPQLVTWLVKTAAKFPWFNHLVLAGVVYAGSGAVNPLSFLVPLNSFLRWAIPGHHPNVVTLQPEEALLAYFGDPPQARGVSAYKAYHALQLHLHHYLGSLSSPQRARLEPYRFPTLIAPPRLMKLRGLVEEKAQRKRKEQAFAVVPRLANLVALGRQRFRWLADLEASVQAVAQSVRTGETTLPALISLKDLDGQKASTYRVWDRATWIAAHVKAYATSAARSAKVTPVPPRHSGLFLQLVGDLPENPWFLRAIAVGALQGSQHPSAEARTYLRRLKLPNLAFAYVSGLLALDMSMGRTLYFARRAAAGTPQDSRVLFGVEPLLAAAAIGQFTLVSLISTGMRIGELQQVTLDRDCMEYGGLPQFNDQTGDWAEGPKRLSWKLYPKGALERERYFVTPYMYEALFLMLDLHKRCSGGASLQPVRPSAGFTHRRRFRGKHKFALQWGGRHIPGETLIQCLAFLLLEHASYDTTGQSVNITPHVLRHGVAGWLRSQGIPLEEIMALLKQVNIAVTDYYSKPSPSELYRTLGPALTALAELAGTDPTTVRTVGEIQTLAEEALKKYGALRHTPGGLCSVFTPCEVQFKCASCPHYVPDPTRRQEVQEKITRLSKGIQLFGELGDYLQADAERVHQRDWERILKEMDALEQVQLVSPPPEEALRSLGAGDLGDGLGRGLEGLQALLA